MILKIYNGEYSLQWDGIYYLALIDYPNIQEWELEKIAKFIAYEKLHKRQTNIECADSCLKKEVLDYIFQHSFLPPFTPTDKIVASTYDLYKSLVTSDYCSHTTTIDAAISIFKTGQLLSAVKAFGRDAEELVLDSRNAASDPIDYFDYVMLGWSNTSSGYRLAMERLLGRAPSEKELQDKFIPGVSFHFIYTDLIKLTGYIFDGYHVAKIKDMLNLFSELYICIIPTHNKSQFENIIPSQLLDRVYYLDHDGEGLEEWTKKVYRIVLKQSGKDSRGKKMKVIDQALLEKVIIERSRTSHKGNYGRLLLLGGTYPYGGAIIMAALAAVKSGAGLVTVGTDRENIPALHSHLPEAMAFSLQDQQLLKEQLEKAEVVLLGPGLRDDAFGENLSKTSLC